MSDVVKNGVKAVRGDEHSSIDVKILPDGVILWRLTGYLTRSAQDAAQRDFDALLARDDRKFRLCVDAEGLFGFEPSVPIQSIRWFARVLDRFSGAALVSNMSTMRAVSNASAKLLPPFPQRVVSTRAEALAYLRTLPLVRAS